MSDWLRELRKLRAAGKDCVRVTVLDVRGSAPREVGAAMLVTADDLIGSIGGGRLEYECTRFAAERLRARLPGPVRQRFPLGAAMGQCCGGVVDVLLEYLPADAGGWVGAALRCSSERAPAVLVTSIGAQGECSQSLLTGGGCHGDMPGDAAVSAARCLLGQGAAATCLRDGETRTLLEPLADEPFSLALFGAGHVGSALVAVLASLDWRVRWIDGRRDIFPGTVPANVTCVESADPAREALAMPAGAAYLVMTHSHALDYEICERILARDDFAWCGLIGSRSKRRRFEKRLRAQGMSEPRIERLTCPIGLPGLQGKRPPEIAVSVAAQLLAVRQSTSSRSSGEAGEARKADVHVLRR